MIVAIIWGIAAILGIVWALKLKKPKEPERPEVLCKSCENLKQIVPYARGTEYQCEHLGAYGCSSYAPLYCKFYKKKPRQEPGQWRMCVYEDQIRDSNAGEIERIMSDPQYIIIPEDKSVSVGANLQRGLNTPTNLQTMQRQKAMLDLAAQAPLEFWHEALDLPKLNTEDDGEYLTVTFGE